VLIRRDHLANVTSLEHERWKRADPLSWGEGLALTADRDMLADEPEPLRAPNHLPSRHDDGAATAELHEVGV